MKFLGLLVASLALLTHLCLAKNDTTTSDSDSDSDNNKNSTTLSEAPAAPAAPANITAATEPADTNATAISEASSNATAAGGNDTAAASNSSSPASPAAAPPAPERNIDTADMATLFNVSKDCGDVLKACYMNHTAAEFEAFNYCEAYRGSKECVAGGEVGQGGQVKRCTDLEQTRISLFSCIPEAFSLGAATDDKCEARLTSCALAAQTPAEASQANLNTQLKLREYMCRPLSTHDCMLQKVAGADCSVYQIQDMYGAVACDSATGLVSSALLAAILFLVSSAL